MLYTSQSLPLSFISLDDWQLIKVSGIDNHAFLQGQLTADISKLSPTHFLFTAHCDPTGKVISNMALFQHQDDIYYIGRKSVTETQIKAFEKYAIFSKVTFEIISSLTMIGLAGNDDNALLASFELNFEHQQNLKIERDIICLKYDFPSTRYIVIGSQSALNHRLSSIETREQTSNQWALLDMEANYPIIDVETSNQYLPQAFNLQHFEAISFDKGCYCGQEMVARAQYRGINKRALYLLIGESEHLPNIGDTLEQKMGDNWRETGSVIAALKLNDQTIWIQVVLNNSVNQEDQFRVKNSTDSYLTIKHETS